MIGRKKEEKGWHGSGILGGREEVDMVRASTSERRQSLNLLVR